MKQEIKHGLRSNFGDAIDNRPTVLGKTVEQLLRWVLAAEAQPDWGPFMPLNASRPCSIISATAGFLILRSTEIA